jgi:hypothetical protein
VLQFVIHVAHTPMDSSQSFRVLVVFCKPCDDLGTGHAARPISEQSLSNRYLYSGSREGRYDQIERRMHSRVLDLYKEPLNCCQQANCTEPEGTNPRSLHPNTSNFDIAGFSLAS